MTVLELIQKLINMPMDKKVCVHHAIWKEPVDVENVEEYEDYIEID